jgi:hypothetical protein
MNVTTQAMVTSLNGSAGACMVGGVYYIDDAGERVVFKFRSRAKQKINICELTYNAGADLFNLEFKRAWSNGLKTISRHEDVYIDEVRPIFEDETGLVLSLGRMMSYEVV